LLLGAWVRSSGFHQQLSISLKQNQHLIETIAYVYVQRLPKVIETIQNMIEVDSHEWKSGMTSFDLHAGRTVSWQVTSCTHPQHMLMVMSKPDHDLLAAATSREPRHHTWLNSC
jgi:plastocyanin